MVTALGKKPTKQKTPHQKKNQTDKGESKKEYMGKMLKKSLSSFLC